MKGIILAGGKGTRLYPLTWVMNKNLLPVYDKPMIYYPLATLMLAGIREVLIISTPEDLGKFEKVLGDGSRYGINITYKQEPKPEGIVKAFTIGEEFIGGDDVALILADNIFYGQGMSMIMKDAVGNATKNKRAIIFGFYVDDARRYGVVEFDKNNKVISVEEKPENPKSNFAITGLYFYDNSVVNKAKQVKPSPRGEYEITDLNRIYLDEDKLDVKLLDRGFTWADTGTMDSLLEASNFVQIMEKNQGIKIAALEEIAFIKGFITREQLENSIEICAKSAYGEYLKKVLKKADLGV